LPSHAEAVRIMGALHSARARQILGTLPGFGIEKNTFIVYNPPAG